MDPGEVLLKPVFWVLNLVLWWLPLCCLLIATVVFSPRHWPSVIVQAGEFIWNVIRTGHGPGYDPTVRRYFKALDYRTS